MLEGKEESLDLEITGYRQAVDTMRNTENWDQLVYENYLDKDIEDAASRYIASYEFQIVQRKLNLTGKELVLDFGAGRCLTSLAFARRGCSVIALDISVDDSVGLGVIHRYPELFDGLRVVPLVADGENLPFLAGTFDIAFCRQVLHHAHDLAKLTRSLVGSLKPGGVFLAYGEHRHPFWSNEGRFRAKHPAVEHGVNEHSYLESEYRRVLKLAGLTRIQISVIYPSIDQVLNPSWRKRAAYALMDLQIVSFFSSFCYRVYQRIVNYCTTGSVVAIYGKKRV